jgi:hypothetical protein
MSQLNDILDDIAEEVARAEAKYAGYHSSHEGYAVIKEEFDELWDEVKHDKCEGTLARQRAEAVQVAATAIRFIKMVDRKAEEGE